MNLAYTLSIALVTRNRPESLEQALKSLQGQANKIYEVLISDDSNNEEYIRMNKETTERYNYTYITGPKKGLYSNRNFVALHVKSTHFKTMDDDHEFPPDHIEACLNAIHKEPDSIWTIGEYTSTHSSMHKTYHFPGQLHPRGFAFKPKNMGNYYGISCGSTIYPVSVIKNNILNIDFYKFGNVYLEYGARLKYHGYMINCLENTYIIHHNNESTSAEIGVEEIIEARFFSIIALSFHHQSCLRNQIQTTLQIVYEIIKNINLLIPLKNAINNYNKIW